MKVLHLTLKKKWFDMIASGEKKEEYREPTGFILPRLLSLPNGFRHDQATIMYKNITDAFWYCAGFKGGRKPGFLWLLRKGANIRQYDVVTFQNGYQPTSNRITVDFKGIEYRKGKSEWGAEPGKEYFVIKLGKIIQSPNTQTEIK